MSTEQEPTPESPTVAPPSYEPPRIVEDQPFEYRSLTCGKITAGCDPDGMLPGSS